MTTTRRVAVVLGTRPEIIKLAEIVKLIGDELFLVHTGQHWDQAMSGAFMLDLDLPDPDVSLAIGGTSRASQIASTLEGLDEVFRRSRPSAVIVQGDTNTVVGGALAANAHEVPLVHVEAGLRSFDRRMPEEHNRVITDHLADLCLAPTEHSRDLLLAEGIADNRIVVTGNTVIGAVSRALESGAERAATLIKRFGIRGGDFIMATIHRPENTDDRDRLEATFSALDELSSFAPVIIALHPRTKARLEEFGLSSLLRSLIVSAPLGYDEFTALCSRAALTISDSGGVQEEASVWKRPVIVVRRSTERPEVTGTFAHLCEPGPPLVRLAQELFRDRVQLAASLQSAPTPYGGMDAARRCVDATHRMLDLAEAAL
jgi:UDP-N-acetylglucosamine 2-epimerase (non-hydrolysing)